MHAWCQLTSFNSLKLTSNPNHVHTKLWQDFGKFGVIREADADRKRSEFMAWALDVKKVRRQTSACAVQHTHMHNLCLLWQSWRLGRGSQLASLKLTNRGPKLCSFAQRTAYEGQRKHS